MLLFFGGFGIFVDESATCRVERKIRPGFRLFSFALFTLDQDSGLQNQEQTKLRNRFSYAVEIFEDRYSLYDVLIILMIDFRK